MKVDRARLLVVAAAGIVVAHAANYVLAIPDPTQRQHVLTATGHGYWPIAVVVAAVCGVSGVVLAARRGWRGDSLPMSTGATVARLAAGQVVLFGLIEAIERMAVGIHPMGYLTSAQFAVGILLQIAVAVAGALLLRGVEAGAGRLASSGPRRAGAGTDQRTWAFPTDDDIVRWWGVAGDARGPPSTLPA